MRIVTSAREAHLQMLLRSSRANEAAPPSVWNLSSSKRGWGILTFPSAALDPALFPDLCGSKLTPLSLPCWYSWNWHHFSFAHGKEKDRAMTLLFWLAFAVVLVFGQQVESPHSCFFWCFLEQSFRWRQDFAQCGQFVLPGGMWRTEDLADHLTWHWLHWLNSAKLQSNKCRHEGAAQGAEKGSAKISTGIFLGGLANTSNKL